MPQCPARAPLELLSFPLNVYARLVELEAGHVEYLHYGLFDTPDTPIGQAQANSTQLLRQYLPPACKLLEIGVGLGTTFQILKEAGYDVTGITPDQAQIEFIAQRFGQNSTKQLRLTRFEEFAESPGQWDAFLFQESSQYIHPVNIFEKAQHLLNRNGCIVILDEFSIRRTPTDEGNLHLFQDFLELAIDSGFELKVHEDVGQRARWTSEWLVRATRRHADILKKEFKIPEDTLCQLNFSNEKYGKNYATGDYTYKMLVLQKKTRISEPLNLIRSDLRDGNVEYRLHPPRNWKAHIRPAPIRLTDLPCAWITTSTIESGVSELALCHLLKNEIGLGQTYFNAYVYAPNQGNSPSILSLKNLNTQFQKSIHTIKLRTNKKIRYWSLYTPEEIHTPWVNNSIQTDWEELGNLSSPHNQSKRFSIKNRITKKIIGEFEWIEQKNNKIQIKNILGPKDKWKIILNQIISLTQKRFNSFELEITADTDTLNAIGFSNNSNNYFESSYAGQLFYINWTSDNTTPAVTTPRGWLGPLPD